MWVVARIDRIDEVNILSINFAFQPLINEKMSEWERITPKDKLNDSLIC